MYTMWDYGIHQINAK